MYELTFQELTVLPAPISLTIGQDIVSSIVHVTLDMLRLRNSERAYGRLRGIHR
jgi:hypothetical protein